MNKVFHFLAFSLRLFFLSLFSYRTRRKLQAVFLITSYSALMYAVFIVCIQSPKSRLQQIDEAYGREEALLDQEQARLNSIIFKATRVPNANMITIATTKTAKEEEQRAHIDEANVISLDDRFFLLEILSRLKDSSNRNK